VVFGRCFDRTAQNPPKNQFHECILLMGPPESSVSPHEVVEPVGSRKDAPDSPNPILSTEEPPECHEPQSTPG
jgi:hypothetical protein